MQHYAPNSAGKNIHLSAVRVDTQYEFAKFMQFAIEKHEKRSRSLLSERVSNTEYAIQKLHPNAFKWYKNLTSTHVSSIFKKYSSNATE